MIFLLVCFLLACVGIFIVLVCEFISIFFTTREYLRISFCSFVELYTAAPKKWHCTDELYARYYLNQSEIRLSFNLIDSVRYFFWFFRELNRQEKAEENEKRTALIQKIQEDIDHYIQETKEALR